MVIIIVIVNYLKMMKEDIMDILKMIKNMLNGKWDFDMVKFNMMIIMKEL